MFMREPGADAQPLSATNIARSVAVLVTAVATLALGVFPAPVLNLVSQAVKALASTGRLPM
jgi:NADH:ubiquinone oxidoreductase subunit 2 (subunit N)